ncbi:histidine phosphatase family protein [Oxyplasma meridianum]|uniref:Histidine phosphatase family protein n=1 Tax=Oxyplasma meridianum TaxID=3073602 RepID=A0AAX4NH85_9ARCH
MQNNQTRYIIARHGETYSNLNRCWQGMGDSPLTERGKKEAESLAERLKNYKISKIITSKLARSVETGKIISERLRVKEVLSSDQLNERNLGILEGYTTQEIREKFGIEFTTITSRDIDRLEGVEAWKPFVRRVFAYLEYVKNENNPGTVLFVTHGGVMRCVFNTLTNTYEQKVLFNNCSYLVLHPEKGNCLIDSVNTMNHMEV